MQVCWSEACTIIVNKINNMLALSVKNYIAVLQRSRLIVQHSAITLTYKIKAAGSRRAGGIMVLVFLFFVVLYWLCAGHSNLAHISQAHPA